MDAQYLNSVSLYLKTCITQHCSTPNIRVVLIDVEIVIAK